MNIEAIKDAFTLIGQALTSVKQVKDLLPNSPQKEVATQALEKAEQALKIAEAQAAKELGYPLCKCEWPPRIMLRIPKTPKFKCLSCESEYDSSPACAGAGSEPTRKSSWMSS